MATKTTWWDKNNDQHEGFIINGKTYMDEAGTTRIPIGATSQTAKGKYQLTEDGGVPLGATKTTYLDPNNQQQTGYIYQGKTYTDKDLTNRVPVGSTVTTNGGSFKMTAGGGIPTYNTAKKNYETNMNAAIKQYMQSGKAQEARIKSATDAAIAEVNRQKENASIARVEADKAARAAYQEAANPFGALEEQRVRLGLDNSGYAESSKLRLASNYAAQVSENLRAMNQQIQALDVKIAEAIAQGDYELAGMYEAQAQTILGQQTALQNTLYQGDINALAAAENARQFDVQTDMQKEQIAADEAAAEKEYKYDFAMQLIEQGKEPSYIAGVVGIPIEDVTALATAFADDISKEEQKEEQAIAREDRQEAENLVLGMVGFVSSINEIPQRIRAASGMTDAEINAMIEGERTRKEEEENKAEKKEKDAIQRQDQKEAQGNIYTLVGENKSLEEIPADMITAAGWDQSFVKILVDSQKGRTDEQKNEIKTAEEKAAQTAAKNTVMAYIEKEYKTDEIPADIRKASGWDDATINKMVANTQNKVKKAEQKEEQTQTDKKKEAAQSNILTLVGNQKTYEEIPADMIAVSGWTPEFVKTLTTKEAARRQEEKKEAKDATDDSNMKTAQSQVESWAYAGIPAASMPANVKKASGWTDAEIDKLKSGYQSGQTVTVPTQTTSGGSGGNNKDSEAAALTEYLKGLLPTIKDSGMTVDEWIGEYASSYGVTSGAEKRELVKLYQEAYPEKAKTSEGMAYGKVIEELNRLKADKNKYRDPNQAVERAIDIVEGAELTPEQIASIKAMYADFFGI